MPPNVDPNLAIRSSIAVKHPNMTENEAQDNQEDKGTDPANVLEEDDFRMFVFKVALCPRRYSHDWNSCVFAHEGERAKRRDPRERRYTPVACPDMKQNKPCPRGDRCTYAHSVFEYWLHPARYRTQLCQSGEACDRPICFFAHNTRQLRQPAETELLPAFSAMGITANGGQAKSSDSSPYDSPKASSTPTFDLADMAVAVSSIRQQQQQQQQRLAVPVAARQQQQLLQKRPPLSVSLADVAPAAPQQYALQYDTSLLSPQLLAGLSSADTNYLNNRRLPVLQSPQFMASPGTWEATSGLTSPLLSHRSSVAAGALDSGLPPPLQHMHWNNVGLGAGVLGNSSAGPPADGCSSPYLAATRDGTPGWPSGNHQRLPQAAAAAAYMSMPMASTPVAMPPPGSLNTTAAMALFGLQLDLELAQAGLHMAAPSAALPSYCAGMDMMQCAHAVGMQQPFPAARAQLGGLSQPPPEARDGGQLRLQQQHYMAAVAAGHLPSPAVGGLDPAAALQIRAAMRSLTQPDISVVQHDQQQQQHLASMARSWSAQLPAFNAKFIDSPVRMGQFIKAAAP